MDVGCGVRKEGRQVGTTNLHGYTVRKDQELEDEGEGYKDDSDKN